MEASSLKWLHNCCLNAARFLCAYHISKEMKLKLILLISFGVSWPQLFKKKRNQLWIHKGK